jgi:YcaO-like protein with predicted kinase domain
MNLISSPKIYKNYKCDIPRNTVEKIKKGFKKIGLDINYKDTLFKNPDFTIYISKAYIDILGIIQYGKGVTKPLAKASAYAELVERFSTGTADIRIPLTKKLGEYQDLLKNINDKNFLKGCVTNKKHKLIDLKNINKYFHKPLSKKEFEEFKKNQLIETFVDAYSITKNNYIKIPINLIEIFSNTNGLAAGNTIEEAIAQASFEIFERYASNKIVSEKIICPTIDTKSIKDNEIQKCIKMLKYSNIDVIIKDFTLNNLIPVVGVLFIDNNLKNDKNKMKKRDYKRINVGAHIDVNEAIKRCFNENLQVIEIYKEKSDVLYKLWTKKLKKKYVGMDDELRYFVRDYHYYGDLSFLEKGKKIDFKSLKSYKNDDSLKDVEKINEICKKQKWDFLVIDYTHKIIQFPTVRVIIPPISTDFDPFAKNVMKLKNFQDKFNYFYGIKDFYKYLKNDSWIKDEKQIKKLIKNIEDYLSQQLDHYYFHVYRDNNFSQLINMLHVLPFLYLSIDQLKEAKKYFQALIELDFHPPIESSFYKDLYRKKYNPKIYKKYIDKINKCLKEDIRYNFELKSNPFSPETGYEKFKDMYFCLLKNINKSFK